MDGLPTLDGFLGVTVNPLHVSLMSWLGKTAKSLFIFLFFFFTTQEGVQESVTSQVSFSHNHMMLCSKEKEKKYK